MQIGRFLLLGRSFVLAGQWAFQAIFWYFWFNSSDRTEFGANLQIASNVLCRIYISGNQLPIEFMLIPSALMWLCNCLQIALSAFLNSYLHSAGPNQLAKVICIAAQMPNWHLKENLFWTYNFSKRSSKQQIMSHLPWSNLRTKVLPKKFPWQEACKQSKYSKWK